MTTATAPKTARTFKLTNTQLVPLRTTDTRPGACAFGLKNEEHYTYKSDDGLTIKFHAHPTKAWQFVFDDGTSPAAWKNAKLLRDFINAWTLAGMDCTDFTPAGFEKAISSITVDA